MLKDLLLNPTIFDTQFPDRLIAFSDLRRLLEQLCESGYLMSPDDDSWDKSLFGCLNGMPEKHKLKFEGVLSLLHDRKRIVKQPRFGNPFNAASTKEIRDSLNQLQSTKRPLYSIINDQRLDVPSLISVDDLDEINIAEAFGMSGSIQTTKDKQNFSAMLLPVLSYARRLRIIDPFFHICSSRHTHTLRTILPLVREQRGHQQSAKITIHCRWNPEWDQNGNPFEKWLATITQLEAEYKHRLDIQVWRQNRDGIKMHDRYFITDQAGLVSAAGADIDDRQQSEWSIKSFRDIPKIIEQYHPNTSPFRHVAEINRDGIDVWE